MLLSKRKPLLLDLYCGAGGASAGYVKADFDVIGVDIVKQDRYPYQFIQYDAKRFLLEYDLSEFDVVHASPPCQLYSSLNNIHRKNYADDIAYVRSLLMQLEKPYVIENVMTAPLIREKSIVLCGSMFGLGVLRHRLFESNILLQQPEHKTHDKSTMVKYSANLSIVGTGMYDIESGRKAMGINWMIKKELSQAIPPAYTEFIGKQLFNVLNYDMKGVI